MKIILMFIKSMYAGIMIGISAVVYLSVENKLAGSLLFSFGLLTIVTQGFYLYTGRIGFIQKISELADMLVIICGNYAGTLLVALAANAAGLEISSVLLAEKKMDNDLVHIFVLSMFCGVMMYLAIDNYNKSKHIVFIIAPVMIFILSGFEHSIANMFYFNFAGIHSLKSYGVLFVMLAGNGLGAKLFGLKPQ